MKSQEQLADLETAYQAFVVTVQELAERAFLAPLGDWTPRDILAHFIGWNRITLEGCSQLQENKQPHYFYDGTNDYRIVNAAFLTQYHSTDRQVLLAEMAATLETLAAYLKKVPESEWERDAGVVHYRGGPATVARCVDSLIRDYRKHRQEILEAASLWEQRFSASLETGPDGVGAFVRIPSDVAAGYGLRGRLPVRGYLNGHAFRGLLTPYSGRHYLGINQPLRQAAGLKIGDEVQVRLERDDEPRRVAVPEDLALALQASPAANTAWEALSYSHRREYVDSIEDAKKPETRQRRIAKTIEMLIPPK